LYFDIVLTVKTARSYSREQWPQINIEWKRVREERGSEAVSTQHEMWNSLTLRHPSIHAHAAKQSKVL